MNTVAPITALSVVFDSDETSALSVAHTYTAMIDELAVMVERSDLADTFPGRRILARLGSLVVELDELGDDLLGPVALVDLVNDVETLRLFIEGCTFSSAVFRSLITPLQELHAALVDLIAVQAWQELER
jgi:hypothetical protein